MAADIFISYAREDEPTAIHLREVLLGKRREHWYAMQQFDVVFGARRHPEQVYQKMERCP